MDTAENEGRFQGNHRRGIPDHIGSAEAKSHSHGERPLSRAFVEKLEDATKELGVDDSGICSVLMSLPEFGIRIIC